MLFTYSGLLFLQFACYQQLLHFFEVDIGNFAVTL
jgi:hypothetical protein